MKRRMVIGLLAWALPGWGAALDFELASEAGFVRLAELPPAWSLVHFWRNDCPPCLDELPMLVQAGKSAQLRLLLVALHRPAADARTPAAVQAALAPPVLNLRGPRQAEGVLSRFGDPKQLLPHTVLLTPERQVCASRTGVISAAWLQSALAACQSGRNSAGRGEVWTGKEG